MEKSDLNVRLKNRLIKDIDIDRSLDDDELKKHISTMVGEELYGSLLAVSERLRVSRELFNSVRGLDVLQEILDDDGITEIMINGPESIFTEKHGVLSRYDGRFSSAERLNDVIQTIAGQSNKRVKELKKKRQNTHISH